jgi:hypothetical protein
LPKEGSREPILADVFAHDVSAIVDAMGRAVEGVEPDERVLRLCDDVRERERDGK